jgi:hypothetical protein
MALFCICHSVRTDGPEHNKNIGMNYAVLWINIIKIIKQHFVLIWTVIFKKMYKPGHNNIIN